MECQDSTPVLRKTTDFETMRALALRSGLEDGSFDNYIIAYGFFVGDRLVACAGLRPKDDVLTVECLAVSEECRRQGLGRALVRIMEDEARRVGAKELWAVARVPEFFVKLGYSKIQSGHPRGPTLKGCINCNQYGKNCNPSVVMRPL